MLGKILPLALPGKYATHLHSVPHNHIFFGRLIGGFERCSCGKIQKNQSLAAHLALQVQNIE